MSDDLKPQTPGELPNVDQDRIARIAEGNVDDVLEQLDGLTTLDLEQLAMVEKQGKDRKTLLGAIAREIERREAGEDPEPVQHKAHNLGNLQDYSNMRGEDVDVSKIDRPVLTRDGWVLPKPRPEA